MSKYQGENNYLDRYFWCSIFVTGQESNIIWWSLFLNKRFVINEIFQWNASKFSTYVLFKRKPYECPGPWVFLYMKYRNFLKYFTATFDQAQTSYFWRVWYDRSWIWHGILADGLECDSTYVFYIQLWHLQHFRCIIRFFDTRLNLLLLGFLKIICYGNTDGMGSKNQLLVGR